MILSLQLNALIDKLWNGELSEASFLEEGSALGVPPARLQSILDDLREVDGLLPEGVAS